MANWDDQPAALGQPRWAIEEARQCAVNRALHLEESADDALCAKRHAYSLRRALVEDVTMAAARHAENVGANAAQFDWTARQGFDVIDELSMALVVGSLGADFDHPSNWNFWEHKRKPAPLIMLGEIPHMNRELIEQAASNYLKLPYRAPALERILVDVLIALEMFAYGEQMVRPVPRIVRAFFRPSSPLQERHVFLAHLIHMFWAAILLLGLALLAGSYLRPFTGDTAADWTASICVGLFVILFVFDTLTLPLRWRYQSRGRGEVRKLILAMTHTYSELDSSGAVSSRRVREVAAKAAEMGVVWPGALFAVLDDNAARTGVL
jgi:hypothetical protein